MMKLIKFIFTENGTEFSWRKAVTALVVISYVIAHVGYSIKHDFNELPASYIAIDGSVILFYFTKSVLRNVKLTSNAENSTK